MYARLLTLIFCALFCCVVEKDIFTDRLFKLELSVLFTCARHIFFFDKKMSISNKESNNNNTRQGDNKKNTLYGFIILFSLFAINMKKEREREKKKYH
jgi:hypothetical protein